MTRQQREVNRRKFLTTGLGTLAATGLVQPAESAESTVAEKANVKVVNDFCAAWSGHDVAKIMIFFADACAYRATETAEAVKGRDAVTNRIKSFVDRVARFEVLETFAKGPMVFNERIDHFTGGPLRSWRGVGVFFLKEGKIVEWYDYTISMDRA
jgi:limonene-1,2-epoxide hydrolase